MNQTPAKTFRLQSMYTLYPLYKHFFLPPYTLLHTGNLLFTVRLFDPVNNTYKLREISTRMRVCPFTRSVTEYSPRDKTAIIDFYRPLPDDAFILC